MDAILGLQKQHLQHWQQGVHADYIQQRQRDATIILALHYSHSTNLLFAATHRGTVHIFHASSILPPPSNKARPLPSAASFSAHDGGVNCMDSTREWLVTGGDDIIHVWSLKQLQSLIGSSSPPPPPLQSITAAQYRLPGRTLTAVPRTLSVLSLPSSSLLVSSHSNHHVLVTDMHTATSVADLACSSHPSTTTSAASSLSILHLADPYHVLLTGGVDGYVRVFDCRDWRLISTYDVTDSMTVTASSTMPTRPAIIALSAASTHTTASSTPSSLVLALTAASTLHAFYYPSLIALPPLLLSSAASLLHSSLLFTAAAIQRVHTDPSLRVLDVKKCDDSNGTVTACCVRYGDRAAVDDVWFVCGSGGRVQVLGCMGGVDMGSLQCR